MVYSLGCCQVWNFKVVTHWVSTWVTELLDGRGSLRIWRKNNYYYFFLCSNFYNNYLWHWSVFVKFTFGIGLQSEASLRAIASFTWSLLHLQLELALNPWIIARLLKRLCKDWKKDWMTKYLPSDSWPVAGISISSKITIATKSIVQGDRSLMVVLLLTITVFE